MVRVKVVGGLGNQLFQYSAGLALAEKLDAELVVDVSAFDSYNLHPLRIDKLNCTAKFSKKSCFLDGVLSNCLFRKFLFWPFFFKKYYFEKSLAFDTSFLSCADGSRLFGYFQTEKYFAGIRDKLLKEFLPSVEFTEYQAEILREIESTNSVSLHVRRGDYVSNASALSTHGLCDRSYFDKALEYLEEEGCFNRRSKTFVFSDDVEWCEKNLRLPSESIFVLGSQTEPEVDMYLMSKCKHNVISNSTFSWWGAWLNNNKNKVVVAPSVWFKDVDLDSSDIIPDSWVRI